ncbi:MAG: N-acetyl-gamma-glutamyl-phosphate reductase [Eubacteriales bacterium]|nr:N-acetyl-gamma-glutamyl-phosphate reductase [Eubacteriales bacterium]
MIKVFIDGGSGTTGLNIRKRLSERSELSLITLDEDHRKDPLRRKDAILESDVAFLCLPDDAARQAVELAGDCDTILIDTSTAHRTSDGWTYGFAELNGQRERIARSKRIANPGCHASGFIALVAPLVKAGLLDPDAKLACFSLTGYSGGGKKMIAQYEDPLNAERLQAPSMYALSQSHKHLPEMTKICGLSSPPVFCPVVSSFYSGMQVTVPVSADILAGGIAELRQVYKSVYRGPIVRYAESPDENGFLSAGAFSGRDDMEISVWGNDERITLVSRFDNLGKGACGAAIQNMNIALSLPEQTGLVLSEDLS